MAENSSIQWTQHTWNPWQGCKKVSPGCKYCYMYRDKKRWKQDPKTVVRSVPTTFTKPLRWHDAAMVFTCSWSDWFIDEADEWRPEAWDIIKSTPHLTYQILTKRPERIIENLPPDWGEGYPNVWLGVSAENQETFNERVPILAEVPARVRFLSIEPMLEPIRFSDVMVSGMFKRPFDKIGWVIVGGESGNEEGEFKYRPCNVEWMEVIVNSCVSLNIPVFVKQMGTHIAKQRKFRDHHGGEIEEFPLTLQVRQFPNL